MAYTARNEYSNENPLANVFNGMFGSEQPGAVVERNTSVSNTGGGGSSPFASILNHAGGYSPQVSGNTPPNGGAYLDPGYAAETPQPGPRPIDPNSPLGRLARERGGEIAPNPPGIDTRGQLPNPPGQGTNPITRGQENPAFSTPGRQRAVGPTPSNPPAPTPTPAPPASELGLGTPVPAPILDQFGIRTNNLDMAPPKPPNTEDPKVATQWYKWWIPSITEQEVIAYRLWGSVPGREGVHIIDWWKAGRPSPYQTATDVTPPPTSTPPPNSTPNPGDINWDWWGQWLQRGVTPGTQNPVDTTPPPVEQPKEPERPNYPQLADDSLRRIRDAMREQANLGLAEKERDLRASAAFNRSSHSGAFDSALARVHGDSAVALESALADLDYGAYEKASDRALDWGKTIIGSQDSRYGIDRDYSATTRGQDVSLILGQVQAQSQRYATDVEAMWRERGLGVEEARIKGEEAYRQKELELREQLGLLDADVTREGNQMNFTVQQWKAINDYIATILGIGPSNLIGRNPVPGGTVVIDEEP